MGRMEEDKITQLSLYAILAVVVARTYFPAIKLMNVQSAWIMVVKSNVNVTMIAFLALQGWIVDKLGTRRRWSKRKGWIVLVIWMVAIVLFLNKYGGYTAIWD